ncbi:nitrate reductase cytochrome c-type subunit [Campylobacter sp. LH-2024]|uniref:Nitrate reductase cytochrome c-type subunit n=2 Tax=Campylobacter molothri TaxID=1032242 RepID=A0ACC5VZK8_9BACT|nr:MULTISPECIES: nitrate reductase cytochrome c-type subunit [unclassified Campylobacter]MBZ7928310.1 nitrate reductase cytochrome c-type subunit [Campylobacter sp. RM10542]MBZ7930752.1 nitrate reductase cytochrome c-type subunit [Campylobacter sp. RM12910]MBZ7932244.1 nitrate reductase cytochrome c-type subunit [Campylobacter sp. RM10543]MBZ7933755.1 nitrate reductase cytochrome c-type subunit [Campylobacter sp. W0065]MBZ7940261.1 nitrate reductase cytochrome c-type subunit [Campylobacter sp.
MMKKKIILLSATATLFLVACGVNNGLSSEQIGLRKASLENENKVSLVEANYTNLQPGESTRFERSYENAPPLIPHSIADMLPITKDNNTCLSCHDKSIAKDVGATPLPASHYYDFRRNKSTKDSISDARFNCTQCHVPQSDAKPLVGNSFKPEFQNEQLKKHSNLIDVINVGVK